MASGERIRSCLRRAGLATMTGLVALCASLAPASSALASGHCRSALTYGPKSGGWALIIGDLRVHDVTCRRAARIGGEYTARDPMPPGWHCQRSRKPITGPTAATGDRGRSSISTSKAMRAERISRLAPAAVLVLAFSVCLAGGVAHGRDASAAPAPVRSCRPFVISKIPVDGSLHRFRAWDVRRSSKVSCAMVRRLLKAAYGTGPLHVIKRVLEPGGSGRPTYWLKGGWRCGNGAGGAACRNVFRPVLNVVDDFGIPEAVTASTG